MNVLHMTGYGVPQSSDKLHPLSLFSEVTRKQFTGCLRIRSRLNVWLIYFENAHLVFASNSINPFERLDRHLHQLSFEVPALVSGVRSQARVLFERGQLAQTDFFPADYAAIQWLVEQQFLQKPQAEHLIATLAKEVLESLLKVTEGEHEWIDSPTLDDCPIYCQLDLRSLVEQCQAELRRQPNPKNSSFLRANPGFAEYPESDVRPNVEMPPSEEETLPSMGARTTHYTIACIDDSPTVLQAMNSFLEDNNLSVVMINDPLKALIQIMRCKPDLILLDVGMPNLDGYELCSMLRRHPSLKTIPIVMVTGHTGFIDRAKAKLAGASGYLTKPFTRPELMKIVFKYLN